MTLFCPQLWMIVPLDGECFVGSYLFVINLFICHKFKDFSPLTSGIYWYWKAYCQSNYHFFDENFFCCQFLRLFSLLLMVFNFTAKHLGTFLFVFIIHSIQYILSIRDFTTFKIRGNSRLFLSLHTVSLIVLLILSSGKPIWHVLLFLHLTYFYLFIFWSGSFIVLLSGQMLQNCLLFIYFFSFIELWVIYSVVLASELFFDTLIIF